MSTPRVTPPPIRKSHDIPQEIINKIIDDVSQIDSKYHLLACSLVSRAFRYPSRGHLFSTTELDVYPTPLGSKKLLSQARNNMESRLRALIDLLAYPSDLGAAIRTLKIANHNFDEATLNELLVLCITRAPHLTTLYLASFHWRSLGADVSKSLIALITRRSVSVLDLSNITNMPRDTMDRCPSLRFLRMNYVTFATSSSASDVGWALTPTMADYLSLSGTYRFIQTPNSAARISLSCIMLTLESQSHVAKFVSLVSATATTYLRSLKLAFPPNVRIDIADGITLGDFRCLSSIWLEMHWDNKLTGIEAFFNSPMPTVLEHIQVIFKAYYDGSPQRVLEFLHEPKDTACFFRRRQHPCVVNVKLVLELRNNAHTTLPPTSDELLQIAERFKRKVGYLPDFRELAEARGLLVPVIGVRLFSVE